MQRNKNEGKTKRGASIQFIVAVYLSFLIYKTSGYKINEIWISAQGEQKVNTNFVQLFH